MASKATNQGSGDNDELQALFDSIASEAVKPKPVPVDDGSGDNDELQQLFDAVVAGTVPAVEPAPKAANEPAAPMTLEERQESVFNKIGHMTRMLHDSLRELGYDRKLQETARQIPDARERLNYIATMTEQAASRVLNATDIAQPLQEGLESGAGALNDRWNKLYAKELSVDEFKLLAGETHKFLGRVESSAQQTNAQLLEIMMAQDFQDLTGQVIKKIVEMAASMESELLRVLLEVMPESKRISSAEGLLNGPVINATEDVVTNQEQVDDLLESLGF